MVPPESLPIFYQILMFCRIFLYVLLFPHKNINLMQIPDILYKIGYSICHQIPERTFFVFGQPMPLCSRCTGIYLGVIISFAFYFFTNTRKGKNSLPPPLFVNIASLFFAIVMGVNALTDSFGFGSYGNDFRFITGILFGFILPYYLLTALNYSKKFNSKNKHIISIEQYLLLLATVFAASFLVLFKVNFILFVSSYLSVLGLLLFAFMLNITVIILIFDEVKKFNKLSYHYAAVFSFLITANEFIILGSIRSQII